MFCQIFLSPQVKRCAIITYKHGIYELPHELPKDLRLKILGNIRKLSKIRRFSGAFRGYKMGTLARNGLSVNDVLPRPVAEGLIP